MYGLNELRHTNYKDNKTVDCPVKGCTIKVERQTKPLKKELKYRCPVHRIYIAPTTFEYETEKENLLWNDSKDMELFCHIKKVKKESRIARDNSEDALTWNVFRFLDKHELLPGFLSYISGKDIKEAELILWSYSPQNKASWPHLNEARHVFEKSRGSEPDILIKTDKVLFLIEAKFNSSNKTPNELTSRNNYETADNKLFSKIFRSNIETVVVKENRYELMRFWLLGSWIAKQLNIDFELYSLVKKSSEKNIEKEFGKHIIESSERKFFRLTWEEIYGFVENLEDSEYKQKLIAYFKNKTSGYNGKGIIKKAFDV